MLRRRSLCVLGLSALCVLAVAAVGRHPTTALAAARPAAQVANPGQGANPTPAQPSAVLQANVNLVLVDVVATDHGNPVFGIDRTRFHVFEDGKERPVVSLDQHRPVQVQAPAMAAQIQAEIASLPAHTYTNLPIYPSTGVTNVLLLDALNTPVEDQAQVRVQMIQFLSNIKPGTELAIFTLASNLRLVEGFTTDAARLAEDIKNKKTAPTQSAFDLKQQNSSANAQLEQQGVFIENVNGGNLDPSIIRAIQTLQEFEGDLTEYQTNLRVRMTLEALDELAEYLSAIPGRKNLIWFSGTFPLTLDPNFENGTRNVEDYAELVRQTSDLLTTARVAVYPIDARGVMNSTTLDAAYQPSQRKTQVSPDGLVMRRTLSANINQDDNTFITQTVDEHATMDIVAEETGGKAFYNTNNLKGAVGDAIGNGDSFYTLGFDPGGKLDGRYRRIKVEVDGGHYDLSYRRGYYADPTGKLWTQGPGGTTPMDRAIVHGAPDSSQVLFASRVLPTTDPAVAGIKMPKGAGGDMAATLKGPLQRYIVDFTVDPTTVAFAPMPGGSYLVDLNIALVAYDPNGKRVNYAGQVFKVSLSPELYAWTQKHGVRARLALDLPQGNDSLRIAVLDATTEHTGSLEIPLRVPK